jgi:hypothetical protein
MANKDYCELVIRNRADAKERHARLMIRNEMNTEQLETFDKEFADLDIKNMFKVGRQIVTIEQLSRTNWDTCIIHPDGSYTSLNYRSSNETGVITSVTAKAVRIDEGRDD